MFFLEEVRFFLEDVEKWSNFSRSKCREACWREHVEKWSNWLDQEERQALYEDGPKRFANGYCEWDESIQSQMRFSWD